MSCPDFQVWLTPATTTGSIDISNYVTSFKTDTSVEKTGGFTLTIHDPNGLMIGSLNYGGKVNILVGYPVNGSPLTTVMYGIIEEQTTRQSSSHNYEVRGIDYTGKLLDQLVLGESYKVTTDIGSLIGEGTSVVGSSINSRVVIKHLMRENYRDDDNIDFNTYVDYNDDCKGWASVSAFTGVGSDFAKYFSQKPLYDCIKEISTDNFTGAGDFLLFIDSDKKLHFEKKPEITYTRSLVDGSIISFDLERTMFKQYTAIMVNAGTDWNKNDIYCAGYNLSAIRQSGWKWGYMDYKGLWDNFSKLYSGVAGETYTTIYNRTKESGRSYAMDQAKNLGIPKWGGKVTIKGTNDFTVGSANNIIVKSKRFQRDANDAIEKSLRLVGVDHTFSENGWYTVLDLKEDYGEIF